MKRLEVQFTLNSPSTATLSVDTLCDIIIDKLGSGAYDAFIQDAKGQFKAYIDVDLYDEGFINQLEQEMRSLVPDLVLSHTTNQLPDIDYNQVWERQHQPVLVDGFCWVRAPFHPHRHDVKYEIEIEPKMSFGTAHHASTYLMLSLLEQTPVQGRRVLDMGSGTGVLAILAAKKGASYVEAIDVDEWAYRNALDNFDRNGVQVNALLGDASSLTADKHFDLILANINRNILLRDMGAYAAVLNPHGTLLISGFYEHDVDVLRLKAEALGLRLMQQKSRNEWTALRFEKTIS